MLYRPNGGTATTPPRFPASAFAEPENRPTRRKQRSRKKNCSSRRHRNDRGQLRSVVRAFTAARLYRSGVFTTLRAATEACGVNTAYIVAAATVLKTEDFALMAATLNGTVQLLAAAKAMKQTADLIAAYRSGDDLAKLALGQAASVEAIWDEVVVPVIDEGGTGSPAHAP